MSDPKTSARITLNVVVDGDIENVQELVYALIDMVDERKDAHVSSHEMLIIARRLWSERNRSDFVGGD